MSYRNIIVNKTEYKYVIGRTHIKIRGVGLFLKYDHGEKVNKWWECEVCGEGYPHCPDMTENDRTTDVQIRPEHIRELILKETA